mgnify:CR=1 FL=1
MKRAAILFFRTTANVSIAKSEAAPDTAPITGEVSEWRVTADSGHDKIHAFCPTCGAPVYLTFTAMPDLIAIHAASLDDPGQFTPQALTYSIRGHAWDTIDPGLQSFEKMPAA